MPEKSGRYEELGAMARHRKKLSRKPGLPPGTLALEGIEKEAPVLSDDDYAASYAAGKYLGVVGMRHHAENIEFHSMIFR